MPLELLTVKDLQEFKTELLRELKSLLFLRETSIEKGLLKTKDVCRILRLTPGTLQNLRKNETIFYKKIGGTIYYRHEDIAELLKRGKRA